MKQYRPTYYKDFRCIASECSDNCCIGWEIDIDESSAAFYRSVGGDFGCRLKENILWDENGSQFILKGERCPFLNEKNLCDIYINLGEGALCEICTQHPRYHEWYGDWKESGVGLCCEAAGRLIFSQDEIAYELVNINEEAGDPVDDELFSALFIARKTAMELVEKENYSALISYGQKLQEALDEDDLSAIRELAAEYKELEFNSSADRNDEALKDLLTFLSGLEPIDPQWPSLLLELRDRLPAEALMTDHPAHRKNMKLLAHYFLYRYFCKALFDGDILSKTLLPLIACAVVTVLNAARCRQNGSFTLEDQVFTAKQFSKEIEYCTENLDALCDHIWELCQTAPQEVSSLCGVFS